MQKYNFIRFPENVTSFEFYHNILKQLNAHFSLNATSKIVFDFSNVEFINPLVLPNLLVCGNQIRKYYHESAELLIPWKPKLLTYLYETGFFDINTKENIFNIDDRIIGGFEVGTYSEAKIYHFSQSNILEKGDISPVIKNSLQVIEKAFGEKLTINENKIEKILIVFEELVWNALYHGGGDCFVCFQSNFGRSTSYKKAFISFSDDGVGFLKSLLGKDASTWNAKFLGHVPDVDNLYCQLAAILEAVFYRSDKEAFGIFDVVKMVSKENGTVRIHNVNTQVVLTPNSLPSEISPSVIMQHFVKLHEDGVNKDPKYSNVRISKEKLSGIHYEFEIPFESEGLK